MFVSLFIHVLFLCCVLHGTSCIRAIRFVIYENSYTLHKLFFYSQCRETVLFDISDKFYRRNTRLLYEKLEFSMEGQIISIT
jgi:hypothetical protein